MSAPAFPPILDQPCLGRRPFGQRIDEPGDLWSELSLDLRPSTPAPRLHTPGPILDGIVKQRRNRLVLRSAVLEDKRADSEQVRHIGSSRRLPLLRPMYLARKHQRSIEAFRQRHTRATARFHPANRSSRWFTVISGSKIFSARQNCSTSSVFFQMPVARPGEVGCAESCCFGVYRTHDTASQDVGLELHQKLVLRGASVYAEFRQSCAAVGLHGVDQLARLVGNRFERRSNQMGSRRARVSSP